MTYLAVKNFEAFQHYKDRAPLWIKLYNALLDDYAFTQLPEAAQAQLMKLWLLASRMENRIPNDPRYIAGAIHSGGRLHLGTLMLAGFLVEVEQSATDSTKSTIAEPEQAATKPEQFDSPPARPRARGEKRREEKRINNTRATPPHEVVDSEFETAWKMFPKRAGTNSKVLARKAWVGRQSAGATAAELLDGTARYAKFCAATAKVGSEFVMQASTFFGTAEHWREPWTLPVAAVDPRAERVVVPPPNTEQRAAASERFDQEEARQTRIDRAYRAARAHWLASWSPTANAEALATLRERADRVLAGMDGPTGDLARTEYFERECAKLGEFPDQDAWVIIENTRRRAKVSSVRDGDGAPSY